MHSLAAVDAIAPPRLARAVFLQALALAGAALVAALPWPRRERVSPAPRPAEPKKEERRIRVVQLPRPVPPPKIDPAPPRPQPPAARPATPPPPRAAPAPAQAPPLARIAADSTAMHGVRMRVLVPRNPGELAAHLRNSGGCLVVSRLAGEGAEVLSVLAVDGQRVVEMSGPPCAGVPRLVRDEALNAALGDPLGRARAASPGDQVVLQVLLSPGLHDTARSALRARFGAVSEEEMGRRAAETGYELTCFAEPAGALRCE
jgi:hypothetical protein